MFFVTGFMGKALNNRRFAMKQATGSSGQTDTIRDREQLIQHGNFLHSQAISMTVKRSGKYILTPFCAIAEWLKNSEICFPGHEKSKGANA